MKLILSVVLAFVMSLGAALAADESVIETHALSLLGQPKYGPDFQHTDYVNPDAPKGGHVRMHTIGKFDSLNPFITAGSPAGLMGLGIETLMSSPLDETSTEYGLIAESVRVPEDDSWVEFTIREEARWHDGSPITVEDVIFSFDTLVKSEAAQPFYAFYYRNVEEVEKTGRRSVKFSFDQSGNRELPQIMGQLPILSKAHWQGRDFSTPSLEPFLMSGPYKVGEVKPGRSITFERVEDYWGKDLPLNVGHYNFDHVTLEYFLDGSVSLEAFKAREYDFRLENTAKLWATEYDFPARRDGLVKVEEIPHDLPTGMQAFAFNIRRDIFQDRRVREALSHAFDFEWTNRTLLY
ncbi:MAG: extracellular solute-binding protein, partial [Alphaproteobacteria bacterium]|nr:extracellular solute-binding protein [Alphaproteobacteria bacterium]